MPILNLSKEQYNTFLNSNSLDDFINLRNSVEVVEGLVSIPKDYIAIRSLSLNEYEKYINNGTCDGSISKDNINVWHYIDKLDSTYNYTHTWSSIELTYNYNTYYLSVLSNNTTNTCTCNNRRQTVTFKHSLTTSQWSRQQTIGNSTTCNKTSTINKVTYVISDRTGSLVCPVTCNFNYNVSFRPAFNFVDNNKSTNIHY